MKTVLLALQKAREIIKSSDLQKSGRNDYSKFDYYTPEQVEALVDKACKETNSIVLCNLKADEFGLYQTLDFIDLESEEKLSFEMRTKHGSITATNETQQMGGTDTYSERYIKMKVFQIKDNNLDIDSQDNRKKEVPKDIQLGKEVTSKTETKTPTKTDPKKSKIVELCKQLGFTGTTAKEYEIYVMGMATYILKPDNYDLIINKLEEKLNKLNK